MAAFRCPSDLSTARVSADYAPTNYVVCTGADTGLGASTSANVGIFRENTSKNISDILDDKLTKNRECTTGSTTGAYTARSRHTGGVTVTMADGAVRFVSETIDLAIWRAASTIMGSNEVQVNF